MDRTRRDGGLERIVRAMHLGDLDYRSVFKGPRQTDKWALSLPASQLGLWIIPHECAHAAAYLAAGAPVKEFVLNTLYGGALYARLIPGTTAKIMSPFTGGEVQGDVGLGLLSMVASLAPYALTPLGHYLAIRGKQNAEPLVAAAGAGLLATHLSGFMGDFFRAGGALVHEGVGYANSMGAAFAQDINDSFPQKFLAYCIGLTWCVGTYIASRYAVSKAMGITATDAAPERAGRSG